ncbi:MAG: hypothetical protein KY468_05440 [Armatimonadetes bacterium]|nr:hypothetical protein [Armatimonadota bacterium]
MAERLWTTLPLSPVKNYDGERYDKLHRLNGESTTQRSPGTFDQVTKEDSEETPEADFLPLDELEDGEGGPETKPDPYQYDSIRAQEAFDEAVAAAQDGREEEAIQHYIRASKIAETAREWHLAAVACQRVGDFLSDPAPPYELDRALRMYRRAVAAYENCGLFAEGRELSYRLMSLKMRRAGELRLPLYHRAELFLQWATAGFGFQPFRVIGMALMTVTLYALVYYVTQGVHRPDYPGALPFLKCFYFSGITFATVGFGDFVPREELRLVALSEGFVGAFMIGYFVAVLATRLSRA